jgi:hypothetical protein
MTNYSRATMLRFKGHLDRGYFVLRVMPDDFFRPLVVELPPGIEVSIGGQWKTSSSISATSLAIPSTPT